MLDPPDLPHPSSYDELLARLTRRVRQAGVDDQILELLQQAFEEAFGKERGALSRPDRRRLFQQVAKAVFCTSLALTMSTRAVP
jgi:hypothetical protein